MTLLTESNSSVNHKIFDSKLTHPFMTIIIPAIVIIISRCWDSIESQRNIESNQMSRYNWTI